MSEDWDFHLLPEVLELDREFIASCMVEIEVLLGDKDTPVASHEYVKQVA